MEFIRIPSPLNLETKDLNASWRKFRQNFEIYLQARGQKQCEDNQVALFFNIAGEEAVAMANRLGLSLENNLSEVMQAFENHCCPQHSEIRERHRFYSRNQLTNESFQDYINALNDLVRTCNFPDPKAMIRDRIIMGINNEPLRQTLLNVQSLNYETTIQLCSAVEQLENKEETNKLNNKPNTSKHLNCTLDFNNLNVNDNKNNACKEIDKKIKDTFSAGKSAEKFVLVEVNRNIFSLDQKFCLACCTAEDLSLGAGICNEFRKQFGGVDMLRAQQVKVGQVAILQNNKRFVYYLVIKDRSRDIGMLVNLFESLKELRDHMVKNRVRFLGIPRLGCGYDRFKWDDVKNVLKSVFEGTNIHVTVCNFKPDGWDDWNGRSDWS